MKRRRPTPKLVADEIRVVASWHDQEVTHTLSTGGLPVGPRDLKAVLDAIAMGLASRAEERPRNDMPLLERQFFREAGFELKPHEGPTPTELGNIAYMTLLKTIFDVAGAARVLGVNTSRIRQRLIARELYGIKDGRRWLVP